MNKPVRSWIEALACALCMAATSSSLAGSSQTRIKSFYVEPSAPPLIQACGPSGDGSCALWTVLNGPQDADLTGYCLTEAACDLLGKSLSEGQLAPVKRIQRITLPEKPRLQFNGPGVVLPPEILVMPVVTGAEEGLAPATLMALRPEWPQQHHELVVGPQGLQPDAGTAARTEPSGEADIWETSEQCLVPEHIAPLSFGTLLRQALGTHLGKEVVNFKTTGVSSAQPGYLVLAVSEVAAKDMPAHPAAILVELPYVATPSGMLIEDKKRPRVLADFSRLIANSTGYSSAIAGVSYRHADHMLYFFSRKAPHDAKEKQTQESYLWRVELTKSHEIIADSFGMAKYQDNSSAVFPASSMALAFGPEETFIIRHAREESFSKSDSFVQSKADTDPAQFSAFRFVKYRSAKY